jgi:hypothetical protein
VFRVSRSADLPPTCKTTMKVLISEVVLAQVFFPAQRSLAFVKDRPRMDRALTYFADSAFARFRAQFDRVFPIPSGLIFAAYPPAN